MTSFRIEVLMKKSIIQLFSALLLLVLFSGCTSSYLTLRDNKNIVLGFGDEQILFAGDIVKENYIDLSPGYIYQYVSKQEEGGLLVYETTVLDMNYRYNYGTLRTMKIIFDAKRVEIIYNANNLTYYQIELKSNDVVNVITKQNTDEDLTFAYGFTHEQFSTVLKRVKKPKDNYRKALHKDVLTLNDPKKAILSQWKSEMLVIDVLFAPVRRMSGR